MNGKIDGEIFTRRFQNISFFNNNFIFKHFGKKIETYVYKKSMQIKLPAFLFIVCCILIAGCSKKHQPQTDIPGSTAPAVEKRPVKKVIHTAVPTVISVDDRGAQKSVDGRLYYDLEGRRYWKNYNDGRYYKFKQGMFDDPAFKPH